MNTATTSTAALVAIIRESETDTASLSKTLAEADSMSLPAGLVASIKSQIMAGVAERAAFAKSAQIELDRRRAADTSRRGGIFAGRMA